MSYQGRCIGGPYDGRDIVSEAGEFEIVVYPAGTMVELADGKVSSRDVIAASASMGKYRLVPCFMWIPEPPVYKAGK